MSFGNPQIKGAAGTDVVPLPAPAPGQVPNSWSVMNEAPVNAVRDGGADGRGIGIDDTVALNRAIALAMTGTRNGSIGSLYIPGGLYQITARLSAVSPIGLRIFGDGWNTIIQQTTSNEPIIEYTDPNVGVGGYGFENLMLSYFAQQIQATHPNSAAIRFRSNSSNGYSFGTFRNLRIDKPVYFIQWGDTSTCAFWNNNIDLAWCTNVSGSLIKNSSPGAIGSPVNKCNRLTHIGRTGAAPTDAALNLAVSNWKFTALDLEDWQDTLVLAFGNSIIGIDGFHIERHHFVTNFGSAINLGQCLIDIRNIDGTYYRDNTGQFYIFRIGLGGAQLGQGYIGSIQTNTYATGNLSTGPIVVVGSAGDGQYVLGPRTTNDTVNVIDPYWIGVDTTQHSFLSVDGGPSNTRSDIALPAASAAYRGRQFRVAGVNAATADTLVECMQSAAGTYSWKVIATG